MQMSMGGYGMPYPMPMPFPAPAGDSGGMAGGAAGGMAGGVTGGMPGGPGGGIVAGSGGGFPAPFPGGQTNAVAANPFCTGDQIGESFSDWLASEVLPRYIEKNFSHLSRDQIRNGYSNVFRGMCSNMNPASTNVFGMPDPHPTIQARVNKILLAHPDVRRQLGCEKDSAPAPKYCGK
jgi:hypothetical protein